MAASKRLALTEDEAAWKAQWRGRPLRARLREVDRLVVLHPQFVGVIREIKKRVGLCIWLGKGSALAVIVPSGGGKSTLAQFCKKLWPDRELPEITLRRVVWFSVPPRPSSLSMSSAALHALGDPQWSAGRTNISQERVQRLLTQCRTRLVVIDNVHDVPERRRHGGVREVGNWIRSMVDNVPALFVAMGAKQTLDVFEANNQARRRSPARRDINYFSVETPDETRRFLRFLYEVDKRLPLAEMSNLAEQDLATRIWMATYGILDYVVKILAEAVVAATKDRREALTLADFKCAFVEVFQDAAPEINPFDLSTPFRPLDRPGEPFFEWLEDGYE